jgi:hypothetical protein
MPSLRTATTDSVSRARSLHDKRPYYGAVFFALVHYLCLIGFLTCATIMVINPKPPSVGPLVISLIICVFSWLVSFIKRRSVRCPLCKGTPLYDSGAVKNARAYRLPPLNYGNTAVLSILFLNRFRCMYCSTSYDMLKKSSNSRYR